MKTRQGFVSNSSTSSFMVFGIYFDSLDEVKKAMLPEKIAEIEKECADHNEKHRNDQYFYEWNLDDRIREDLCHTYFGDNSLVFGESVGSVDYIEEMRSIEGLQEDYQAAKETIKEYFGDGQDEPMLWGIRSEG